MDVQENMTKIADLKEEKHKLWSEPKLFQTRGCSKCNGDLSLPTYHFMCGHVYHEGCTYEENNIKVCRKCQ